MIKKWDVSVQVHKVLDELVEALPRRSPLREQAAALAHEVSKLGRQPYVTVEGEAEFDGFTAVDMIGDLLECLADPQAYLETSLKQYAENEESIEELVQRLADFITSGAGVSAWWLDRARNEIEHKIPALLH